MQQNIFPLHQHGVQHYPWNTQHTIQPSFSIPNIPHLLSTGRTHLSASQGFYSSQESVTLLLTLIYYHQVFIPLVQSPNLRYPSLTYPPGIELHTIKTMSQTQLIMLKQYLNNKQCP